VQRARDHTTAMLHWWSRAEISRVDLAVRRLDSAMIWHRNLPLALDLERLPLAWARAENLRRAEIYVRPARGEAWPLLFLDDVRTDLARRIAGKYSAAVIQTSSAGGCHVWLRCSSALDEAARRDAQRWLARRCGADPASISGEHLGRLAGFKNWKRGGTWVNVIATTDVAPWRPPEGALAKAHATCQPATADDLSRSARDSSASGKEWAWVCARLERGDCAGSLVSSLAELARTRRGKDAERYARRTVRRAILHITRGR